MNKERKQKNIPKIDAFILSLAKKIAIVNKEESFFLFAKKQFDEYKNVLESLDKDTLETLLIEVNEMDEATKGNFINLIQLIQNECLIILEDYYNGDLFSALSKLDYLLRADPSRYKLNDCLANYFCLSFAVKRNKELIRCVDWNT